ncbi:MvaI/BcnI family restriction endonuclease [Glaciecola siphonariae]|uniref:MvaI/BcnI family restriction endonuclease n=1 Tax=Glaciecola siphonariae TaxID=521012 RepID=UPI0036D39438
MSDIKTAFTKLGCTKVVFKALANNDNSKQQIYFGGNFDVIQLIPSGETRSDGMSSKGPIFKSPLNFSWIEPEQEPEQAKGTQFILYPKYPEVRLSGFLKGCKLAPSHLMKPSTRGQRKERENTHRYLFLGIKKDQVFAYASAWESRLSQQASDLIAKEETRLITSVFYELSVQTIDSKEKLLARLQEIYEMGPVQSHRLDKDGNKIQYKAQNGAGYTLEALFGITPNGSSDPDFEDWELKSHSSSVVTLMTPEPNCGTYLDSLEVFVRTYGKVKENERMDFTGIHKHGETNTKTHLTLQLIGFDRKTSKIIEPNGGLHLIDENGVLAAGWGFDKLIDHWKKKHSKTCFVSVSKIKAPTPEYAFGPEIRIAEGATLPNFLNSIFDKSIYYDPGVNLKFIECSWKPKKRNQLRIKWSDLISLFTEIKDLSLKPK